MELRVGCPMWAHKAWQGRHFPASLGRDEQLPAYASWCNAVEGNTTFYGPPTERTVRSWADETPPEFRFVFKVPRTVTHERRLRNASGELAAFARLLEPLGERAETLSVQLPRSFGPSDLGALATFLRGAPSTHRYAVEVRHPRFFDATPAARALERLLAEHGAEWIAFDTTVLFSAPPRSEAERDGWAKKPRLPRRTAAIGDRPILRYIGRDDAESTVAGWQPWLPVIATWLEERRTPAVFVHTPDNSEAPPLARRLHDEVRALVPGLQPLPEPVRREPARPEPTTLF